MSYVTAQEVIDSRGDGQAWAAPRCITPSEFVKLRKMTDLGYAQIASREGFDTVFPAKAGIQG